MSTNTQACDWRKCPGRATLPCTIILKGQRDYIGMYISGSIILLVGKTMHNFSIGALPSCLPPTSACLLRRFIEPESRIKSSKERYLAHVSQFPDRFSALHIQSRRFRVHTEPGKSGKWLTFTKVRENLE